MFEKTAAALTDLGAVITTREIKQQPELWEETLEIFKANQEKIKDFLAMVEKSAEGKKVRVIFTGAGTSQYVGDTLVPYLSQKGDHEHFQFESIGTTNIVAAPKEYLFEDETTLLVSFARSGNSPESVATVEIANHYIKNVFHLTVTCAPEGALAKAAKNDSRNLLLLMPALSNDQGFAMTGSYSCMTLTGLLTFDTTDVATKESYVTAITALGHEVLSREEEVQKIIDLDFNRIVYLGSGSLAGLTREAQLKVLELTAGKIATCYDSSMGFRHGPKSFVDGKTLVFDFIHNDSYTRQYDVDILEEIKGDEIAAAVTGIGQSGDLNFSGNTFTFEKSATVLPDGYLALPCVMYAQTVSLLASIKVGNTPDTPSPSGTVNRVVKGVTIHPFEK